VSEQFLAEEGLEKVREAMSKCRAVFPPKEPANALPYYSCIHGLGHGLLSWEGLTVPKALVDCDILDEAEQQYCYDGVFMEYSFSAPNTAFDETAPWKFCGELDSAYHSSCARYQPSIFTGRFHFDLLTSASLCAEAPTETLRGFCVDAVGFAFSYAARDNPLMIKSMCESIPNESYQYRCTIAAAGELVFQRFRDSEKNAPALCATLPEPQTTECMAYVRGIMGK